MYVWVHTDCITTTYTVKHFSDSHITCRLETYVHIQHYLLLSSLQEKAQGRNAHYKLTSTVMLWLQTIKAASGTMNLGGSLTRQAEIDHAVNDSNPHIANIGRMIEVRVFVVPTCTVLHSY